MRAVVQLAASAALLWLAWRMAGGEALAARLAAVEPAWLALGLVLTLPMQCLSALRWRGTAHRLGVPIRFRRALAEYYVASFLNAVLPTGIAGEAARVWRHGRAPAGSGPARYRKALHAVMLERCAGQMALAAVLVAGLVANHAALPAVVSSLLPAVALGVLALPAAGVAVSLALGEGGAAQRLDGLLGDVRRAFAPWAPLLQQAGLSIAVTATYVLVFACAARAAGVTLEPVAATLLVPAVLFAMAVPVAAGGLGPREAAAAALWPLLGLPPADGVAASLLYGVVVLGGSLPALVLLRRGQADAVPATPASTG